MTDTNIYEWDIFISHASEDKQTIALPLANALTRCGFRVWIDKQQLTIGDSLRRKIDEGLSKSRFGIVILSPRFFAKEWPKKELDALVSRDDGETKVIIPIWHEVSKSNVMSFSPILASKLSISTSEGLDKVLTAILRAICTDELEFQRRLSALTGGERYAIDVRIAKEWGILKENDECKRCGSKGIYNAEVESSGEEVATYELKYCEHCGYLNVKRYMN